MATTTRIAAQLTAGHKLKLNKTTLATVILVNNSINPNEVEIVTTHGRTKMPGAALVLEGNTAPVANAGVDQATGVGAQVLDGSASSHPDGDAFTYAWTLTVKPVSSVAVLALATTAAPTFTADLVGTYTASLVVTDQYGVASVANTVDVVVS